MCHPPESTLESQMGIAGRDSVTICQVPAPVLGRLNGTLCHGADTFRIGVI